MDATALDEVTSEVSLRQREGVNVSRDVSNYWKAEFFSRERMADPCRVYPAILLGWIREVPPPPLVLPSLLTFLQVVGKVCFPAEAPLKQGHAKCGEMDDFGSAASSLLNS